MTSKERDKVAHAMYKYLWQLANPERMQKARRKYKLNNRETVLKGRRKWRAANVEIERERCRNWCKRNMGKVLAKNARWRAARRKARIGDIKAIAKIYARAREFRKWFKVEVDHIIPLSKGGAHSPENLQIIHAFENSRKKDRLNYRPKVIFI